MLGLSCVGCSLACMYVVFISVGFTPTTATTAIEVAQNMEKGAKVRHKIIPKPKVSLFYTVILSCSVC